MGSVGRVLVAVPRIKDALGRLGPTARPESVKGTLEAERQVPTSNEIFIPRKRCLHIDVDQTAIIPSAARNIPSEGQVNIFNLAKNAETSVDQIERFCARNLPLSK